jgi:hypothetical protein
MATIKGHLDQAQTNKKKKKHNNSELEPAINSSDPTINKEGDLYLSLEAPNLRTHLCYAAIMDTTEQVYRDQKGKFTIPSSRGNKYAFWLYNIQQQH